MVGANVFNMTTAETGQTLNTNAAASKSRAAVSIAGIFAAMMGEGNSVARDSAGTQNKMTATAADSEPADVYNMYQYRETGISQAKTPELADRIAGEEETLDDFGQQIVAAVVEKLEIPEEEVLAAMEILGLTVYDLMEPQNLIRLAAELTDVVEPAELLVHPGFTELLQDAGTLGSELMESLDIPVEQMDGFVAQMNMLTAQMDAEASQGELPEEFDLPKQTVMPEFAAEGIEQPDAGGEIRPVEISGEEQPTEPVQSRTEAIEIAPIMEEEPVQAESVQAVPEQTAQRQEQAKPEKAEENEETKPQTEPMQVQKPVVETKEAVGQEQKEQPEDDSQPRQSGSHRQPVQEPVTGVQMTVQDLKAAVIAEAPQTPDDSYLSIDTMDIIRQVAEKMRVSISEDMTSMELQLNPEHLGKVYMQVTAKEGTVSAQITAANEAVKNALEMQMAELKENLGQSGVRVNAIEVTVASHAFEQNLEQNSNREEQKGERAEAASRRRNIRLDSLEEFEDLMTEEEALTARIMRENGNTMDLTA